jgi:hypothetical protein
MIQPPQYTCKLLNQLNFLRKCATNLNVLRKNNPHVEDKIDNPLFKDYDAVLPKVYLPVVKDLLIKPHPIL